MKKKLAFLLLLFLALPASGFWCDCAEAADPSRGMASVERPGCGCCESSALETSSCDPGVMERKPRAIVLDISWGPSAGISASAVRRGHEPDVQTSVPFPSYLSRLSLFLLDSSLRL
jgi:hypothetical protein